MTLDDTEAVERKFGKVTPIATEDIQSAIDCDSRLRKDFEPGDSLYHYSTVSFLAGDFGYLRVRGREIVGMYVVGMS